MTASVAETPCPQCGKKQLEIERRLTAKPIGSWSLAGMQMKMTAVDWPWIVCRNCYVESPAKDGK